MLIAAQASTGRKLAQAPAPSNCQTVYEVIESRGLTDFQEALDMDDLQRKAQLQSTYICTLHAIEQACMDASSILLACPSYTCRLRVHVHSLEAVRVLLPKTGTNAICKLVCCH